MALKQFIKEREDGTRRPRSPSLRTPASSWHLNRADLIEDAMQKDGHRTWGFVIYRTTYSSNNDWARFLSSLRTETEDCFQFYNGMDVLESKADTVIDDVRRFDGATSHAVREHFRQWVADNAAAEQGSDPGLSPRYRFAVQVDAEALASIMNEQSISDGLNYHENKGWVRLIDVDWRLGRWSAEEGYEPVEGVRQEDVGWMKQHWKEINGDLYCRCNDRNFWPCFYTRPPRLRYWYDAGSHYMQSCSTEEGICVGDTWN